MVLFECSSKRRMRVKPVFHSYVNYFSLAIFISYPANVNRRRIMYSDIVIPVIYTKIRWNKGQGNMQFLK